LSGPRASIGSIPFDSTLRDALGDSLRVLPDACAAFAVSGVVPKAVAAPKSVAKFALVIAAATAEGGTVVIRGAGTKMRRPPPPSSVDLVLDVHAWKGIVAHAASDLTVTVRAGTTLASLAAELEKAGQFWPCDAPFAQSATVGGTIAANANGALRQRYGAIRDLVLGARFLTPDGRSISTGARVVKSVAGYDIQKLLAGSFGTLGLIVEVTLKLSAFADAETSVIAHFDDSAAACAASAAIAGSSVFPMATTLHDAASARRIGALASVGQRSGWVLVVRCAGNRRAIARAEDRVEAMCRAAGGRLVATLDRGGTMRAWSDVRELAGGDRYGAGSHAVLKVASLPSDASRALDAARAAWPRAEITAHPSSGIAYVNLPVDEDAPDIGAAPHLESFERAGWTSSWLSVPDALAARVSIPRQRVDAVRLMRAVKAAFDPDGVLDPGRLPGGV
jgi:glycolate oxidase FAD binding subunit